ncbi:MAG: hypothetical protein WC346_03260 [Methanogenium sp.]|jgi:hypothetical protein
MKKQDVAKILIELYDEYLENTVVERTQEFNDLEKGGKQKLLLKGNLDGFIVYLQNKEKIEKSVKIKKQSEKQDVLELKKEEAQKIQTIYEAYVGKILPGSRLTATAKAKISTRLKEFSIEEILQGIDNFSKDSWWMENNAKRGITWFFYSEDRTEQFKNLTPRQKNTKEKLRKGSFEEEPF